MACHFDLSGTDGDVRAPTVMPMPGGFAINSPIALTSSSGDDHEAVVGDFVTADVERTRRLARSAAEIDRLGDGRNIRPRMEDRRGAARTVIARREITEERRSYDSD